MKKNNSSRKNRLLALLLSALMGSSVVALSACNEDSSSDSSNSSSSSVSSTEEVEQTEEEKNYLIQNPDFATVSNSNLKYFSTTAASWTRAANNPSTGTAQSSKAASGIIDTSDKAWTSMTTNNTDGIDAKTLTEAQAKEKWSKLTLKDKLAYYKKWEDENKDDDKKLTDLDFYEAVTIDDDDLPKATTKNPRTWDYSATEAAKDDYDSHVLMIHNDYDTTSNHKQGTAQKYTSSSTVTVAAGTAMELSLWVKTAELRSATTDNAENGQEPVDKGAYIRITHSVGNQQLEPLEVKNINTELMGIPETENNGWKQYTFYLNGSSFSDTTFTLVLGLGQGGGDDVNEYVNGYAFFDDIQCKPISDFETKTEALEAFTLAENEAGQKTINAFDDSSDKFALDFSGSTFVASDYLSNTFAYEYTFEENKTGEKFTAVNGAASGIDKEENAKKPTSLGSAINGANDVAKVFANPADMANGNRYLKAVYNNYLLGKDATESKFYQKLGENNKATLMLLSAEGAAITAKNDYKITLQGTEEQKKYLAFSFFVKTSAANGTAGATVTLKDTKGNVLSSITAIDTTTATPIAIGDDKDVYDGWQQCFFFIAAEKDAELTLTFQLGPTTVIGTTQDAYKPGFAAFAGFKTYDFTDSDDVVLDEEFDLAAEGTYAKIVTVKDTENENNDNFDTVAAVSPNGEGIKDGYATPKNYKLYEGGAAIKKAETLETAGLLNQKYAEEYNKNGILEALGATLKKDDNGTEVDTTATERWNEVFGGGLLGTANQPLVIYNQDSNKSYGFVGATKTLAANGYAAVSMRVKVSAGAKAYVYLIDTSDDSFNKKLSISRSITYWYDDDGNVCAGDPSASNFQNKNIAFMREENGLYTVNEAWWNTVSTAPVPTGYYANLQAYGAPQNNNLLLAEGFNPYNYTDQWQHEGNNGIAFYGYSETNTNGKVIRTAYDRPSSKAERNVVNDFENILSTIEFSTNGGKDDKPVSPVRYAAQDAKELYFEIDGTATAGEWADVTFFVKTGETAKNYRLEIWLGDRNATSSEIPANAYVIADSRNVGTLDETAYSNNLTAREDDANDQFESVFSFFDTAKFLRYNKDLDKNKVGNSYDNYLQSEKTSTIAYLTYQQGTTFETYANFSLADVAVETDPVEDDTEEDSDNTTDDEVNVWLLASSIAIAAVLMLAVISLIIRKAFKSARRKHGQTPKHNKK